MNYYLLKENQKLFILVLRCADRVYCAMQVQDVNVIRMESRLSRGDGSHFEVIVDCDIDQEPLQELTQQLRKRVDNIEIGHCNSSALQDDGRRVKSLA